MTQEIPIEVDVQQVKELLDQGGPLLLLDCREPSEIETVAIEGTHRIPMGELQDRVAELEEFKSQRVVVHCHLGGRSLHVANWMRQQGFEQAQSMAGGIEAWAIQIDPSLPRY